MPENGIVRKSPIVIIRDLLALQFAASALYFLAASLAYFAQVWRSLALDDIISFQVAQWIFVLLAETMIVFGIFFDYLGALFENTLHPFAFRTSGGFIVVLQYFFEASHMFLRLREMCLETRRELFVSGRFHHFGKGFDNLRLRAVEVFEFLNVKVFERF